MNTIGRYPLVRVLGSGAFATVWLARDDDLDVDVAIKLLADNWSADADVRQRFLHEARLLRRITSPRVVRVHDVGIQGDQPYFVMDFVPHGSLADLDRTGRPPTEALRLGAEAAYAVGELHAWGVLHRDVKPSNLLVDRDGGRTRLLLADLGLAKAIAEGSGFTVTAGTPAYTAPEQARGGALDARADVYSVAAVTYELLCGRRPFPTTGMGDVLDRDPAGAPAPIATEVGLPAALDALLADALAADPVRRPGSAAALGDALLGLAEAPGGPGGPDPDPAASAGRSWPLRVVVLLALLVFLGAGVVAYLVSAA